MDYATEVSGEGDDDDDDPYSFEPTPGYDFSTPNLARRLSSLKKKKSYDDNFVRPEEYKQPDEGAVLDYEEVPEFIRQQIDMMGLGDNAQIQFVNGTYKISLASGLVNVYCVKILSSFVGLQFLLRILLIFVELLEMAIVCIMLVRLL